MFGGKNEEQQFNDLKVMKLINPSERQPGTRFPCVALELLLVVFPSWINSAVAVETLGSYFSPILTASQILLTG